MKTHFNIAPIDPAILALLQLLQPASLETLARESDGTVLAKVLKAGQLPIHFERLEQDGFILRTSREMFVVSPKAFPLISYSLRDQDRDKARLLELNKRRIRENRNNFGLGA